MSWGSVLVGTESMSLSSTARSAGGKSRAEDTLTRLAEQVDAYGQVLDRATLVTTQRWEERARQRIPSWWGSTVVEETPVAIVVHERRQSKDNSRRLNPMALAQLLWRTEALDELRQCGQARGLSAKARYYVWERELLVSSCDGTDHTPAQCEEGLVPWSLPRLFPYPPLACVCVAKVWVRSTLDRRAGQVHNAVIAVVRLDW